MTHVLTDNLTMLSNGSSVDRWLDYAFKWPICWQTTSLLSFQIIHLLTDNLTMFLNDPSVDRQLHHTFKWPICWQMTRLSSDPPVDGQLDYFAFKWPICWQMTMLSNDPSVDRQLDYYAFKWPICWQMTWQRFQMTHLLTDNLTAMLSNDPSVDRELNYAFRWLICWQTSMLLNDPSVDRQLDYALRWLICWQTSMLSNGLSVDIWLDWASNPSAVCLVTGQPTQWQNMTLAGSEGVAQGCVNQNSVSVLVDHFWTKQMSPATQIWDCEWLCRWFHAQMASMCAPCSVTQTPGGSLRQEDISSRKDPVQFISFQFKMVSMRPEKPICAPPRLSEVSPTLPLKRLPLKDPDSKHWFMTSLLQPLP